MKFDREILQVLCPYGKWPHPRGMQIVDAESGRRMARAEKFSDVLSEGVPVYFGHSDDSMPRRACRSVGRVKRICRTQGGLAVLVSYSADTFEKIVSGEVRAMSPRWQMEKTDDGNFRPVRLVSIGLTNNPNISGSGRIISASDTATKGAVKTPDFSPLAKDAAKISERIGKCAKSAAEIVVQTKEIGISDRLWAFRSKLCGDPKRNAPDNAARRRTDIAELARERSVRLGEPYVKSFAAVRRDFI